VPGNPFSPVRPSDTSPAHPFETHVLPLWPCHQLALLHSHAQCFHHRMQEWRTDCLVAAEVAHMARVLHAWQDTVGYVEEGGGDAGAGGHRALQGAGAPPGSSRGGSKSRSSSSSSSSSSSGSKSDSSSASGGGIDVLQLRHAVLLRCAWDALAAAAKAARASDLERAARGDDLQVGAGSMGG